MKALQNLNNLKLIQETKDIKIKIQEINNIFIECEEILKSLTKQKDNLLQNYENLQSKLKAKQE
jgi:hypothetical protein